MSAQTTTPIKQYFSNAPYTRFILKDGTVCHFIDHRFRTQDPAVQKELEEELEVMKHKGQGNLFYIRQDQYVVDSLIDDPLSGLRKQIAQQERQKILAEMAAEVTTQKNKEMVVNVPAGKAAAEPINPANTGKIGMATSVDVGGKTSK